MAVMAVTAAAGWRGKDGGLYLGRSPLVVPGVMLVLLMLALMLLPLQSKAEADRPPFREWLSGIKQQAREQGITEATIALLDDLQPDERVIGFDRKQPEFVQTFDEYLIARVTEYRIRRAREEFAANREALEKIGKAYGVDPQFMIAFWGLESSFGQYQGKYSILRSLATLAYDPRRTTFFTKQLLAALSILDEGHVPPEEFVGGWAGAMGQNQFIPTSFLRYAQDFDGDGHKNIWSNQLDVWASIAYYLSSNGWRAGAGWGTQVEVPAGFDFEALKPKTVPTGCRALRYHTSKKPVSEWARLGVTGDLARLPEGEYALIIPAENEESHWLVGGNFRSILAYNCANKYAVSVGLLADEVLKK